MLVLWVGGCDTLRLLSIFKKSIIIDIIDCSKAGLNTLPFNIRTKVFSSFSKSVSSLELYLYPFPLTSSGNLHTYFMFLKVNHFISFFLWHLNMKQMLYYWTNFSFNLSTPCSDWCVHHSLNHSISRYFFKHWLFLKSCIRAWRWVRCILYPKEAYSLVELAIPRFWPDFCHLLAWQVSLTLWTYFFFLLHLKNGHYHLKSL